MTVAELIKELRKLKQPDLIVEFESIDGSCERAVNRVILVEKDELDAMMYNTRPLWDVVNKKRKKRKKRSRK